MEITQEEKEQSLFHQLGIDQDTDNSDDFEGNYTYKGVEYLLVGGYENTLERDKGGELHGKVVDSKLKVEIDEMHSGVDFDIEASEEIKEELENYLSYNN